MSRCTGVCICVQCHPLQTNLRQTSLSQKFCLRQWLWISLLFFPLSFWLLVVVFFRQICVNIFFFSSLMVPATLFQRVSIVCICMYITWDYVNLEKNICFILFYCLCNACMLSLTFKIYMCVCVCLKAYYNLFSLYRLFRQKYMESIDLFKWQKTSLPMLFYAMDVQ